MNNYSLYPPASQDGEASSSRFRKEPVGIEEAMCRHDGLVHAFIQRQGGGTISYEEALQAGRIGLWRAILGYDPSRGTAFSTYAWVAIGRTIHQAVVQNARGRVRWYFEPLPGRAG